MIRDIEFVVMGMCCFRAGWVIGRNLQRWWHYR